MLIEGLWSILGYASLTIEMVNVRLLTLALFIYAISLYISAFRWLVASRLSYTRFNMWGAMESLLVGTFVNNLITFYSIAGETARIGWASLRLRVDSARLLVGALAERASELPIALAYIILSTTTPLIKLSILGISIPATHNLRAYLHNMMRAMRELSSSPSRLALVLLLSIAIWLLDTLRITTIASAFGVNIAFTAALALTVIHIASRFSPTPAGVGVLEGGFIGYLSLLGIPVEETVLVVVGERLISTVIPTALGALIVFYRGGIGVLKSSIKGVTIEDSPGNR